MDNYHETPLHMAARGGFEEPVALYLRIPSFCFGMRAYIVLIGCLGPRCFTQLGLVQPNSCKEACTRTWLL